MIWVGSGKRTFSFSAGYPGRLSFSFPPSIVPKFLQSTLFCEGLGWARDPLDPVLVLRDLLFWDCKQFCGRVFHLPPTSSCVGENWTKLLQHFCSQNQQIMTFALGLLPSSQEGKIKIPDPWVDGVSKQIGLLRARVLMKASRERGISEGWWRVQRRLPEEMGLQLLCQEWLHLRR